MAQEPDTDLVAEATRIFMGEEPPDPEPPPPEEPEKPKKGRGKAAQNAQNDAEPPAAPEPVTDEPDVTAAADAAMGPLERFFGRPDADDFVQVRGGAMYLPARRRVMWMRGEIGPHPDWTIETREVKVVEGTFTGNKVTGGYARIEANVYDDIGRLIATGRKTEYSERFMDFVEKAETGAIARALAVAGYGTEAALDLDEGLEGDRIADAPVAVAGRPINITQSAIPGIQAGGRSTNVTDAQIAEMARYGRILNLGLGLAEVVTSVTGTEIDFPTGSDPKTQQQVLVAALKGLTFDQGGAIIGALSQAAKKAQA